MTDEVENFKFKDNSDIEKCIPDNSPAEFEIKNPKTVVDYSEVNTGYLKNNLTSKKLLEMIEKDSYKIDDSSLVDLIKKSKYITISLGMNDIISQVKYDELSDKLIYDKDIVMTFLKRNVKEKEGIISNCPNCGAETQLTELGKCRYCNTLLFPIRYNWTLIKFETM